MLREMAEEDPKLTVGAVKKYIAKLAKRIDAIVDNLAAVKQLRWPHQTYLPDPENESVYRRMMPLF